MRDWPACTSRGISPFHRLIRSRSRRTSPRMFARYRPGSAAGLVSATLRSANCLPPGEKTRIRPFFWSRYAWRWVRPGSRRDLLHDRQVRFLLELALDDQVGSPGLEPEGPLDRVLLVIDAQGEDEIRLGLPGDLELDAGTIGKPEVASDRRIFAVGHRSARVLAPVASGPLAPASRPGRSDRDRSNRRRRAIGRRDGGWIVERGCGPAAVRPARPAGRPGPAASRTARPRPPARSRNRRSGLGCVAGGGHSMAFTSFQAKSDGDAGRRGLPAQNSRPGRSPDLTGCGSAVGQVQHRLRCEGSPAGPRRARPWPAAPPARWRRAGRTAGPGPRSMIADVGCTSGRPLSWIDPSGTVKLGPVKSGNPKQRF